tara:strand:- start:45 stop:455 length:411 start_codon:yes stop_codon:yes gene_type:complete
MKTFNQFIIEAGKLIPGGPYSSKPRKPQVGDKATDPEALKAIELERQIGKTGTMPTNVKPVYKKPVQQPKTEQPKTEQPKAEQPKTEQPRSSSAVQRTTSTNTQRRTVGEISPNQIKPYKYDREASKKAFDNLTGG